jgi:hypothetical protein
MMADRVNIVIQLEPPIELLGFRDRSPRALMSKFFAAQFSWRTDAPDYY